MRNGSLLALTMGAFVLVGCPQPPMPPDAMDVATDARDAMNVHDARDVIDASDVHSDARDVADVADASDVTGPIDAGCAFDTVYSYGYEGGLALSTDSSALSPTRGFTRRRVFNDPDAGALECHTQIPACGTAGSIDVGDVMSAIEDPDVQNALGQPVAVVFGYDSRPEDGQVFAFHRSDGRSFFVGEPCSGRPDCIEVPDALAVLVGELQALDNQEVSRPECAALQ